MRWIFPFVIAMAVGACAAKNNGGDDDDQTGDDGGDTSDVTNPDDGSQSDTSQGSDTSTPPASAVTIIVEPDGQGGQQVVDAINAAKKSVHMTMYLLSSTDVINALIARHKAGIDVKVLLDPAPQGDSNTAVYAQLKGAGVPVAYSSTTFTYTHEKCFIVDGTTAWIMTMNLTESSPTANREYLAIDTSAADITEAETIFEGDFADTPPTSVSGPLVVAPINALTYLTGLIGQAQSTIDIEVEELSDYHTADALKAALARGVKVRVVLSNDTLTTSGQSAVAEIKGAGGKLVTLATPYIHAKAIVIDNTTAFVGSENLSTGSLEYNRELGVIFAIASEVAKVESTISSDFSKGTAL